MDHLNLGPVYLPVLISDTFLWRKLGFVLLGYSISYVSAYKYFSIYFPAYIYFSSPYILKKTVKTVLGLFGKYQWNFYAFADAIFQQRYPGVKFKLSGTFLKEKCPNLRFSSNLFVSRIDRLMRLDFVSGLTQNRTVRYLI